ENLVEGSPGLGAAKAVAAWMASPEHRENILRAGWRDIGIAAIHDHSAPGAFGDRPVTVITADFGVRHYCPESLVRRDRIFCAECRRVQRRGWEAAMAGRTEVMLGEQEREVLERWVRRPKTSQALAFRCRVVLAAAEGRSSREIASELGCNADT